MYQRRVLYANENGVLPTALPNDADVVALDEAHVAVVDGQIGGVHFQPLALAAFHTAARQETCGVIQTIASSVLVSQIYTIDECRAVLVTYPSRGLLLPFGPCTADHPCQHDSGQ